MFDEIKPFLSKYEVVNVNSVSKMEWSGFINKKIDGKAKLIFVFFFRKKCDIKDPLLPSYDSNLFDFAILTTLPF